MPEVPKMNETAMFGLNVPKLEVTLPDGQKVTIRESNGEDDENLSRMKDTKDGTAMQKYLANLIVDPITTHEQVAAWKIRNKYYLLLQSRVFTHGPDVFFEYLFDGEKSPVSLKENLAQYLTDFSKPQGEKDPKPACGRYPTNGATSFRVQLQSGKVFELDYLTGNMELASLTRDVNMMSINERLTARNIRIQMDANTFQEIQRFNMISSREMSELRTKVEEADPDFTLNVTLVSPNTGKREILSLFTLADFFFPRA